MALTPEQKAQWEQKKQEIGFQPSTSTGPTAGQQILQEVQRRKDIKAKQEFNAEVENVDGIAGVAQGVGKDAFGTVIAKPAYRLAQVTGTGIGMGLEKLGKVTGKEGLSDYGRRLQEVAGKDANVPTPFGKTRVEEQKEFGKGGIRQVAGDVAKSASYLAPVGRAGAAVSGIAKGNILKAGISGATAGGLGGGLTGLGEGLSDENAGVAEVAIQTAMGAGGGAVAGGVLGAGGAAISKATKGAQKEISKNIARAKGDESQLIDDAVELTRPVRSKAERIDAIARGRATEKGIPGLKEVKIEKPSMRDVEVAKAVSGVVKKGKNQIQNIASISDEVGRIDDEIVEGLKSNNSIFNDNLLRSRLAEAKEKSRVIFAGDEVLEKRYNAIIEEMLDTVENNNLEGLFAARKKFDQTVRAKFPRTFDGNPSDNVTRNAILDVRREVNNFIADTLPEGNTFSKQLRQEHLMLEAIENLAEQAELMTKEGKSRSWLNMVLTSAGLGALGYLGSQLVAKPVQAATGGDGSN